MSSVIGGGVESGALGMPDKCCTEEFHTHFVLLFKKPPGLLCVCSTSEQQQAVQM